MDLDSRALAAFRTSWEFSEAYVAEDSVLAEARARAVADFLIAAGLPAEMIEIDAMGEADAPVATDDGVAEPLNRCAEIRVVRL